MQVARGLPAFVGIGLEASPYDTIQGRRQICGEPGGPPGCHLRQDQPERVDIRPLIGFFSFGSLRRHVGGRADDVAGLSQAGITRRSGQAEVQHFDAGLGHHDVRGLQIPVHDAPRVSHGQGFGNLGSESKGL